MMKTRNIFGGAIALFALTASANAQTVFSENFDGYVGPSISGSQYQTFLPVYAGGTFPGWTGDGINNSHAVRLSIGNYALQLFSGYAGGTPDQPNTLTLSTGIAANDTGTLYEVSFVAAPSVWSSGSQITTASDGLLVEVLSAGGTILDSFTFQPGAWPGGSSSQNSFVPASFYYSGDGSGDIRIRLVSSPVNTGHFGGAIDNLMIKVAVDTDVDGVADDVDNCPLDWNDDQADNDGDTEGDVCDPDDDNDTVADLDDNCPTDVNFLQEDFDGDGLGNICDPSFVGDESVEDVTLAAVDIQTIIVGLNPPGGNGMIAKLTGKGGVLPKLSNAVDRYNFGVIDLDTYLEELQAVLDKLTAFDNQLAAKIGNGQIAGTEATDLEAASAAVRVTVGDLIANAGF